MVPLSFLDLSVKIANNKIRVKTSKDPRHLHREKLLHLLFSWEVDHTQKVAEIDDQEIAKCDQEIVKFAPKWPLHQLAKIDLAILRLAFWELHNKPEVPVKVVIDEAIELAKTYGTETSYSFINGVLASWLNQNKHE